MKRSQLFVLLAAVAAVAVIAVASRGNGKEHGDAAKTSSTAAPENAVVVSVASSPEKLALLQKAAAAYNDTKPDVSGRPVFVSVKKANSGEEETAIAAAAGGERGDKPVVWSPASSFWAQLLEHDADQDLVSASSPSIVRSPLVLAMWEPLARALGWPEKKIGWADLFRLARNQREWATYAPPGYGAFKLVHTNPSVSTSGLEAVSAAYFAATGKRNGLTVADVDRPDVERQIRAIENSIVHYGNNTLFIEDQLRKYGPGYASAVAMEETTLVDFNKDRGGQPKLVGIYPSEGTFFSDSPYIVLNAPWVNKDERTAAAGFQRFLAKYVTPEAAARDGFRPADPAAAPVAPVDAAHGADPQQPARVLVAPAPAVLNHIQDAWFKQRKAANIMLVVDTSSSMYREGRLAHAKRGLQGFLGQLSPRDRVGLIRFSDDVQNLVPIRPFAENAGRLRTSVRKLEADGYTALYAATEKAVDDVAALNDPTRINAVVLLTDGEDTVGKPRMDQLIPKLESHAGEEARSPIRVLPIAYGKEAQASKQVLDRIGNSSDGGDATKGDTGNIESVYRTISSFF
jgi:Ca-activated chloride channel family protein